jgi:phosphoglycerate dehydrogenase-like enzyme
MRPKMLLLDTPCDKAIEIFKQEFELSAGWELPDIIYTGLTPIDTIVPVVCPCTGIDHVKSPHIIYLDDDFKRGIGRAVTSTAEHTWSLLLQLAKMKRMQLSNKTIGIVGYGRIGQQIKRYAMSHDMEINIGDTWTCPQDRLRLLRESDIITLHVPLNSETNGMISTYEFGAMKDGAMLINTSRQEIVNIEDLKEAIKTKDIFYADDFKNNVDLCEYANVIQTRHIAGNCMEAREATDIYVATKTIEYWRSRTL